MSNHHENAAMNPKPAEAAAEPEEAHKLRMIVSHATGGNLQYDTAMSVNAICCEITAMRNKVWQAAQEAVKSTCLATPATEKAVEPVAWMYAPPNDGRCHPSAFYSAITKIPPTGWSETPLYAHPPAADVAGFREALVGMVETYTSLINSGDAGHWDPEKDEPVIAARSALTALPEEPSA